MGIVLELCEYVRFSTLAESGSGGKGSLPPDNVEGMQSPP